MPMRSLDQREPVPPTSTPARPKLRATAGRAAAVFALALSVAGCSVSYPLFDKDGADDIKTGSIARAAQTDPTTGYKVDPADKVTAAPLPPPPGSEKPAPAMATAPSAYAAPVTQTPSEPPSGLTPSDWTYARGALGLAMGADAANASVPWANPDSGSYGSFTASAGPTTDNGATCRPFAASHSAGGQVQRLEGTACRTAAGYWEAVAIRTAASRTL